MIKIKRLREGQSLNLSRLKEQETGWKVFEDHPVISLYDSINILKKNYDHIDLASSVLSLSNEKAKDLLERNGFNIEGYPEEFDELRQHIQGKAKWNWDEIMPGPVFFRDPEEFELYSDSYNVGENQYEKFKVCAIRNGFNDMDAKEVYSTANFGGMAGVGVIGYMHDAIKGQVHGSAILYMRDSVNGIGSYVIKGKKSISGNPEILADLIDHGHYSLGEIYGTTDWEYS